MERRSRDGFWEEVFLAEYQALTRYAYTFLKSQFDAEDLVQKLFLGLLEKGTVLKTMNVARPYLFRSVHNNCLNELSRKRKTESLSTLTVQPIARLSDTAESPLLEKELENEIKNVIDLLPLKCKEAFQHSRIDKLSYAQIADKMQVSVKTVESHIGKAMRILRLELAEYLVVLTLIILTESKWY